mmetsp:Transcript_6477/g.16081  ORF Transcript_6477/g.16081 Transcript_6477/m.16081 type:complete len:120 (-) Transcript_6477:4074-4433(-)
MLTSFRYIPFSFCNSSSCVPISAITPVWNTYITSAFFTVERRWAIVILVLFSIALSSASCTTASLLLSRALVASSRRRSSGLRTTARAMAMRCFCPPLSCPPPAPTSVLYPSVCSRMKE